MQDYLAEKGWEGTKHESGMYIVVDEAGEGDARPTLNDEVTIFYKGYLLDGFNLTEHKKSLQLFHYFN